MAKFAGTVEERGGGGGVLSKVLVTYKTLLLGS
jgi:hypothetical protein